MTREQMQQAMHDILNAHDAAIAAIRSANDGLRGVTAGMRTANDAMRETIDAHDAAIVSAIEANRAAIQLLNRLIDEGVSE
jgi:ABC-type sugar transport system substrate-binding protein